MWSKLGWPSHTSLPSCARFDQTRLAGPQDTPIVTTIQSSTITHQPTNYNSASHTLTQCTHTHPSTNHKTLINNFDDEHKHQQHTHTPNQTNHPTTGFARLTNELKNEKHWVVAVDVALDGVGDLEGGTRASTIHPCKNNRHHDANRVACAPWTTTNARHTLAVIAAKPH